jgi:hypothetical protein
MGMRDLKNNIEVIPLLNTATPTAATASSKYIDLAGLAQGLTLEITAVGVVTGGGSFAVTLQDADASKELLIEAA